jgi:hypothetical protein
MKIFLDNSTLNFTQGVPIAEYDSITNTLVGIYNSGFYSCINITRIALYKLISHGIVPLNISFKDTLLSYKEVSTDDLYPLLYTANTEAIKDIKTNFNFEYFCPTIINYKDFNFNQFASIENAFFSPSNIVSKTIDSLNEKYNITSSNTIAVLHRGNDKWREATLVDPLLWIKQIESQLDEDYRILIQTDEETTKNTFLNHFKDRCFIFEEMIFNNTYAKPNNDFKNWAVCFESVMRIISQCKKIITHSGNCGFIPILYRNNTSHTVQLNRSGVFTS